MTPMKYNFDAEVGEGQELVSSLTTLTKMALNKKAGKNMFAKKYSVVEEDYKALNDVLKEKCLTFSAKQSGIDSTVDVLTKRGLVSAFSNSNFEFHFFSIQTATLAVLLADTEVEAMAGFINLNTVGLGDSMTFDIGTKALYDVEDTSYGNNVTRPRKHFKQTVTVAPTPKECSVQFDVVQMLTANYDFGAEMAKVVLSIRTKQYQDAVDVLYAGAPLVGTPFYSAIFNKANYSALGDRVEGVNGGMPRSYASRAAYAEASDTVTTGFMVQDELVKKTYIGDLFGIPSVIIPQAVDTSDASFGFRVPNDKIIVTTGNAPVQMVQEDYVHVLFDDGAKKNVMSISYKYIFSYTVALVSGNPYGIQEV